MPYIFSCCPTFRGTFSLPVTTTGHPDQSPSDWPSSAFTVKITDSSLDFSVPYALLLTTICFHLYPIKHQFHPSNSAYSAIHDFMPSWFQHLFGGWHFFPGTLCPLTASAFIPTQTKSILYVKSCSHFSASRSFYEWDDSNYIWSYPLKRQWSIVGCPAWLSMDSTIHGQVWCNWFTGKFLLFSANYFCLLFWGMPSATLPMVITDGCL